MKPLLIYIVCLSLIFAFRSKPAYQIFTGKKAKSIEFNKMMKGLKDADVVFFGETHNNSVCHWLQLQVLKELGKTTGKEVMIGAEMFEADDQLILNEYLAGLIREVHFQKDAKIWDNYNTDYAPLVEFARENKLPFIATNIPRRYANIVARFGFEGLDKLEDEARNYMAPLPIEVDYELSSYKEISGMMGAHMKRNKNGENNMVNAQAIKDATMAHFILNSWTQGHVFYHLNGSFHSKNKEGIIPFLRQSSPDLKIVTITVIDQENMDHLEAVNLHSCVRGCFLLYTAVLWPRPVQAGVLRY